MPRTISANDIALDGKILNNLPGTIDAIAGVTSLDADSTARRIASLKRRGLVVSKVEKVGIPAVWSKA